jgi:hypothetical protein
MSGTRTSCLSSPLALLRCTSLDQTALLGGGACGTQLRTPSGSPVGAVLPKRSASAGCSCTSLPRLAARVPPTYVGPFASCHAQSPFLMRRTHGMKPRTSSYTRKPFMLFPTHLRMALRSTRAEGTRAAGGTHEVGSECREQPMAPDRKAKPHPQESREACGAVFHTPRL